jgi:hypothetical protein
MHAHKSAPGVGGFSRPESEASANDDSGRWSSINFSICEHVAHLSVL